MTSAPTLTTQQLILRASTFADFDAYATFHASKRAEYINILDREDAWYAFASETAHWHLMGFGPWTMESQKDGALVGFVGVIQHIYPQPELIWMVYGGFEGKGLAFEGASAARDWIFDNSKLNSIVSLIHHKNQRSIALAKRLGAVHDTKNKINDGRDLVYRHLRPEAMI